MKSRFLPARSYTRLALLPIAIVSMGGLWSCGSGSSGPSGPVEVPVNLTSTSLTNLPSGVTATMQEIGVPVDSNQSFNPPPGSWPDDIVVDNLGQLWFAQHHSNQVGRLRQSGGSWFYTGYPVATPNPEMDSIAVDSTRQIVWVTENQGNKIVRLDYGARSPVVTEIDARTPTNQTPVPGDIRLDATGTPWFTEGYEGDPAGNPHTHAVARIDPATNQLTEFTQSPSPGGLDGITFDSTGALWYVELNANKIVRVINNQSTEFTMPRPGAIPTNIVVDTHGMVWVTEQDPSANAIAVLDPTKSGASQWREIPVPTPNSWPAGICLDNAGNVWFTEFNAGKIGVVRADTQTILDFPIPTPNSGPEDVVATSDGRLFFTEQYGNKVGQLIVSGIPGASRRLAGQ